MSQTTLPGSTPDSTPYRSIVKDAYTTRDASDSSDTRLEIAAWRIEVVADDEDEGSIKDETGKLRYNLILDAALADVGAEEIARRTGLKSYADERGGRAASTIRGYRQNASRLRSKAEGGLPSSHPVKRVLRRYARSHDLGHFEDDESTEEEGGPAPPADAAPIEMGAMFRAYKLARSIASQNGFVFAPQEGEPVAVEDNERIDHDEIRAEDRPVGDTKAMCMLTKPNGSVYEYEIDLDTKSLTPVDGAIPPTGW